MASNVIYVKCTINGFPGTPLAVCGRLVTTAPHEEQVQQWNKESAHLGIVYELITKEEWLKTRDL